MLVVKTGIEVLRQKSKSKATVLGACSGLVHRGWASHLHRVRRRKNKQTLEEEEGELEDGTLDKGARRQG